MERSYGKIATDSRKAVSLPRLPRDRIQEVQLIPRWPITPSNAEDAVRGPEPEPEPISEVISTEPVPQSSSYEHGTQTCSVVKGVPRSQRRGLFARLAILGEIVDPYQYSHKTKWFIVFLTAYAAAAAPLGSAILFRMTAFRLVKTHIFVAESVIASLSQVAAELKTTPTVVNLTVALYMLSLAIFPLWWSSLSEVFGRRNVYLISFLLFTVFAILCAVSTSIAMLTVMRILCAGAAASMQTVGAGTIADVWKPEERGQAISFFYLGPLCGPLLAPVIGGALSQGGDGEQPCGFSQSTEVGDQNSFRLFKKRANLDERRSRPSC